jgi:transcriptional regulator with XRE-family HTH domain
MVMAQTHLTFNLSGFWPAMQNDDEAFCKALGQRIALFRKEKGLTQVQLCAMINVAQQTLSHYEGGHLRVPLGLLPRLADIFELSLDELMTGQPAPKHAGKRGPAPRLQQQLMAISALPKAQQKAVDLFLDALLAQHTPRAQAGSGAEQAG